MEFNSERDLIDAYTNGLRGAYCDPEHLEKFLSTLQTPYFSDAAPHLQGEGKGKISTLYKSVLKFQPDSYSAKYNRQKIGDCFAPCTYVHMGDGSTKQIKNVKVGDYVYSHKNKKRRVLRIIKKPYNGKIIKLKIDYNNKPTYVTPDHRYIHLDKNNNQNWKAIGDLTKGDFLLMPYGIDNNETKKIIYDLSKYYDGQTKWNENRKKISEAKLGENNSQYKDGSYLMVESRLNKNIAYSWIDNKYIYYSHGKKKVKRFIELDEDLSWLFGIYLAEGGASYGKIDFSLNRNEIEYQNKICKIFEEKFGVKAIIKNMPSKPNVSVVTCCSTLLCDFFKTIMPGNVYNKKIPLEIFQSLENVRLACLRGWMDGDGHVSVRDTKIKQSNGYASYSFGVIGRSVSNWLWRGMARLGRSCKLVVSEGEGKILKNRKIPSGTAILRGFDAITLYPEFEQEVKTKIKLHDKKRKTNDGIKVKIKSIQYEDYDGFVYCLEVEEDHSFIANNIAVSNCVSFATKNSLNALRAVQIDIDGRSEEWITETATEATYGSRGGNFEGMSCSRACEFIHQVGGIALRMKYDGIIDLTEYNPRIGQNWGGHGVPKELCDILKKNQVRSIAHARTLEEVRDGLAHGYPAIICSNQGFSNVRDNKGFARAQGAWSHGLAAISCDDYTYGEIAVMICNSWGAWNSGGHPEWGPIPDGAFLAHEEDVRRMIAAGGTFILSNAVGFPSKKLPNYGTSSYL